MGNTNINVSGNGNSIMSGLSYSPVKGVNLSLNYQGWLPDDDIEPQNRILLSIEYKI